MPLARVFKESRDVTAELAALGLEEICLQRAIIAGDLARSACTPNDPPLFRGTMFWARTTRVLREELASLGFEAADISGLATTCNRERKVAIVVVSGDDGTGDADGESPHSKYRKGPLMIKVVGQNAEQLDLFSLMEMAPAPTATKPDEPATWILLVHRAPGTNEIRAELSLPREMSKDAKVTGWAKRIILKPIPSGETDSPGPTAPVTDPVDVPVGRKTRPQS
jgi:hypothetical protein